VYTNSTGAVGWRTCVCDAVEALQLPEIVQGQAVSGAHRQGVGEGFSGVRVFPHAHELHSTGKRRGRAHRMKVTMGCIPLNDNGTGGKVSGAIIAMLQSSQGERRPSRRSGRAPTMITVTRDLLHTNLRQLAT
jgi:hypothetical protein